MLELSYVHASVIATMAYTSLMQTVEIELKFPVADIGFLRARLAALAFELKTPRSFETNTLYDTADRDLQARGQLLRLRRYGDTWTLTHKARPANGNTVPDQSRYKSRVETETGIEDGSAMSAILRDLGYAPVFRYEKWRTEWTSTDNLGATGNLVLDETPIGIYAELEGSSGWIDRMLALIGIDPSICTTESYGRLFLAWKQRTGSAADNLTFAEISEELSCPAKQA